MLLLNIKSDKDRCNQNNHEWKDCGPVRAIYGSKTLVVGLGDIVASCLPGYQETFKVFDKAAFAAMKDEAYFINVGRGTAVDTDALCDALENKKLAGAVLDVTDPEPLPKEHRLWDAPNVLITPHVSGGYRVKEAHNRIVKIAGKNLVHLVKGEPFENIVDRKTGYRINY